MAVNKNALIRYQTLDRCFRNRGRMYFMEDLVEECNKALEEINFKTNGIRKRQIYEDIRFMESEQGWSIPLEKHYFGKKTYYRYSESSFSINNQPLNESEATQLKLALSIISRFAGTPQFEWIHEVTPMIESKLGLIETKKNIISFEANVDLKGIEYLSTFFNAIVNERVLDVKYQDFKTAKPYSFFFHPYFLKQYNNRWFVFGLNESNGNPQWNLAIDRIIEIKETPRSYEADITEWEDYFYDFLGVTKLQDKPLEEVVLLFTNDIANYIISKPIHPTQKHKIVENGLEVRIQVIPNFELKQLILSFGKNVKIVRPNHLAQLISEELENTLTHYLK